eukprot:825778-Rhodomonas_salina.1
MPLRYAPTPFPVLISARTGTGHADAPLRDEPHALAAHGRPRPQGATDSAVLVPQYRLPQAPTALQYYRLPLAPTSL